MCICTPEKRTPICPSCPMCEKEREKYGYKPLELQPQRAPITEVEKELNDPDLPKLENWFSYHPPSEDQKVAYGQLRDGGYMLARCILLHCPPSADRTAALRKVREAIMTANAAIACGGK